MVLDQFLGVLLGRDFKGFDREREGERERERQWGRVSPQSDRQEVDQQEGGNSPPGLLGHRWPCSGAGRGPR